MVCALKEFHIEVILCPVDDVDAITFLDELSIPVPTTGDVSGIDVTVELDGLSQHHSHILQVLVNL